jgi:predicted nucleotidyltransferase component of viral defense system
VLDPRFVERVAAGLGTEPGLVEKEWHVVRALRVIADVDHGETRPIFSGGTSLSVGWGLIRRFSEDIDFKVAMPPPTNPSRGRAQRRKFREDVLSALIDAGFRLVCEPRKSSAFFAADFTYPNAFDPVAGLRPHIQVEMTFEPPALTPVERPLRSLVAQAQGAEPEIAAFPCVNPVETAADKLSALAWRVCARSRGSPKDDPTIIRHLHDLAALETLIAADPAFASLLKEAASADTGRGGGLVPKHPSDRFGQMLQRLATDPLWAAEYVKFVNDKSFANPNSRISFSNALAAAARLLSQFAPERKLSPTHHPRVDGG